MRNLNVYAFYDKKSELYDTPFCAFDDLSAHRHFHQVAMKPGSLIADFTEDFDLYQVSIFTVTLGCMEEFKQPKLIMEGKDVAATMRGENKDA